MDAAAAVNAPAGALQENLDRKIWTDTITDVVANPPGGVLVVWASVDEEGEPSDVVEVVNFHNPGRVVRTPAAAAIARAEALPGSPLRCVTIKDLVALKRYAGGLSDHADIVQLLARNPDADLAAIRATAAPFDAGGRLETLIEQAAKTQLRRR